METVEKKNTPKSVKDVVDSNQEFINSFDLKKEDVKDLKVFMTTLVKRTSKSGRDYALIELQLDPIYLNKLEISFDDIYEYELARLKLKLPTHDEKNYEINEYNVPARVRFVKGMALNKKTNEEYEYMSLELIYNSKFNKRFYFSGTKKGLLIELEERGLLDINWEHQPEKESKDVENPVPLDY